MAAIPDLDPQETQEWLEALDGVLENEGPDRAHFLLERLIEEAGGPDLELLGEKPDSRRPAREV